MARLRHANHVTAVLAEFEPVAVDQAWFQGMNLQLGDAPPATLLRDGDPDEATLAAGRVFVAIS